MPIGPLPKIAFENAAQVHQRYELADEVVDGLRTDLTPTEFLDQLCEHELWSEVIKFLAQALPKREVIAWALQCVRSNSDGTASPKAAAAIQATEVWLANPNEDHRRAAHVAAEEAGLGTPEGCLALGVFFSGGSLGPAHLEHPVPPPDELTGKAITGALLLASVSMEPENAPARLRDFVDRGLTIARETSNSNSAM